MSEAVSSCLSEGARRRAGDFRNALSGPLRDALFEEVPKAMERGIKRAHVDIIMDRMELLGRSRKVVAEAASLDRSCFSQWVHLKTQPDWKHLKLVKQCLGLSRDVKPPPEHRTTWKYRVAVPWVARYVVAQHIPNGSELTKGLKGYLHQAEYYLLAATHSLRCDPAIETASTMFEQIPTELKVEFPYFLETDHLTLMTRYGDAFRLTALTEEEASG